MLIQLQEHNLRSILIELQERERKACKPLELFFFFCINIAKTFLDLEIWKLDGENPLKLMAHKNFWSFTDYLEGGKKFNFFFQYLLCLENQTLKYLYLFGFEEF